MGYSPWGRKESDITELLHFHSYYHSLTYYSWAETALGPKVLLGEGNGNPLQYSCVENPMDRGPWQGTVHGVAKSLTLLKQLSSYA